VRSVNLSPKDQERFCRYLLLLKEDLDKNLGRALRRANTLVKISLYLESDELAFITRVLRSVLEDHILLYRALRSEGLMRVRILGGEIKVPDEDTNKGLALLKNNRLEILETVDDVKRFVNGQLSFGEMCEKLNKVEISVLKLIEKYGGEWRNQYD